MKKILVIGASGFVGRCLARTLLADGYVVRALARSPARVADLADAGGEVVQGDITDPASLVRALEGVEAAYIAIHTISPQHARTAGQGFMEVELEGLENIVAACRASGTHRLVYLTSLGVAPDASSLWTRERWRAQQFLLTSGLDVTVIQPGQIAGVGGTGFDRMVSEARKPLALMLSRGGQKWRNIALDDLIYYLIGVLDDPRTSGQCYEVGGDDVLTNDEMVDVAAAVLGRKPPVKLHFPRPLLRALAPLIERVSKLPTGAITGLVDSMGDDAIGDPTPLRQILPRPPLSYREAVERALTH